MNVLLDEKQTSGNTWAQKTSARMYHRQRPEPEPEGRVQLSDLSGLEEQMSVYEAEFGRAIDALKRVYVFEDSKEVDAFLRSHRSVVSTLLDGAEHLRRSFGDDPPLLLAVMSDDGPPTTVNALVLWRGDPTDARLALRRFDESWWLNILRNVGGRIVFDFELVR